jgi:hypothetical protein
MLPDKPKSNDARRALNDLSVENKKARRLRLAWIQWILTTYRTFTRQQIKYMICDRAFDVGLRLEKGIIDPGEPDWNNPKTRIMRIAQYTDAITTDSSDALLNLSFQCKRALFGENDERWIKELEGTFMKSVGMVYLQHEDLNGARWAWICMVASEQYNAFTKALRKVQLRKNNCWIRLGHNPPEGQARNARRNGTKYCDTDIVYNDRRGNNTKTRAHNVDG